MERVRERGQELCVLWVEGRDEELHRQNLSAVLSFSSHGSAAPAFGGEQRRCKNVRQKHSHSGTLGDL